MSENSSIEEVYFNYEKAKKYVTKISDDITSISDNNKNIESLLIDLGDYWKGTAKDNFVNEAQTYVDAINKYKNYLDNNYKGLSKIEDSYTLLDESYYSKEI